MKKQFLLTAALSMTFGLGFAQTAASAQERLTISPAERALTIKMAPVDAKAEVSNRPSTPKRTVANGVYYSRPEGTLFSTDTNEGYGYYVNYLFAPPYADLTWTNRASAPDKTTWTVNGNSVDADRVVNNNFLNASYGFCDYVFYTPTLSSGTASYQLGESGDYFTSRGGKSYYYVTDGAYMSYFDSRTTASSYGFGGLDNSNLFGTGNVTSGGSTYTSMGTFEIFPAPASPLYVDTIRLETMNLQQQPVPAGKELTMQIYNVVLDEDGEETVGDSLIATLTCGANDYTNFYEYDYSTRGYGYRYYDYIFFTQKETGPFGNEVVTPVTLTDKFAVVITGCEQTGVDVNILGVVECPEDSIMSGAGMVVTDGNNAYYYYRYGNGVTQNIAFKGVFDYVEGMATAYSSDGTTYNDFNVLVVPTAGTTTGNDVVNKSSSSFNYTQVMTAFDWEDEEGNSNYDFVDVPDWLELTAETYNGDYENYGIVSVAKADALPATQTGRYAVIYMEGRGYTSTTPVIIVQGEVDLTAIEATVADQLKKSTNGRMYNLNGQQVNNNYKGIVIKDGKKTLKK